jgi:ABC-2 type transport system ATP-binding protein
VRALTKRFVELTAVDGLTFAVRQGELFGIVGPDGAGKTTTLRMLAGVLRPTSGDAIVGGISVRVDPERIKPDIAYMAQRFGLYEDLTVRENLAFAAAIYRVPRGERSRRLERLYAFSRLDEFESRLAGQLSGGMKQKLALSCALIHRPRILLLDEPTFGVDPISRRELWIILHEMMREGMTILVSTSYLDEAERCDRVALLSAGRILALDSPAALVGRLGDRLLALPASRPRLVRDTLRADPDVARASLFGETLHVLLHDGSQWQDVAARLRARGIEHGTARSLEPSLEDLFIHLVSDRPEPARA